MKSENGQSDEVKNIKDINTNPTFYFITNCRYKTKFFTLFLCLFCPNRNLLT